MLEEYDERYLRVFGAAFEAGVLAAQELSDDDLALLRRYSGVVGLIADHVALTRERESPRALADVEKT
jgi:hypothetical protein